MNIYDLLNNINYTKEDLFQKEDTEEDYIPYVVNRGLSMSYDTILYANEMNLRSFLDKEEQYQYLRLAIPKKKRYINWSKKDRSSKDIQLISAYYKYNTESALEALTLLNEQQIAEIRMLMDIGGRKDERK